MEPPAIRSMEAVARVWLAKSPRPHPQFAPAHGGVTSHVLLTKLSSLPEAGVATASDKCLSTHLNDA
jgi:hypothetical protein